MNSKFRFLKTKGSRTKELIYNYSIYREYGLLIEINEFTPLYKEQADINREFIVKNLTKLL